MANVTPIPLHDTPIFAQLQQEYAARERYDTIFGENSEETDPDGAE